MARPRKPWFRKQTKCWYVEIDGEQHDLGKNRTEATRKYHELMSQKPEAPSATQLVVILDKFLDWVQVHRRASYRWYSNEQTKLTHEAVRQFSSKSNASPNDTSLPTRYGEDVTPQVVGQIVASAVS